MPTAFGASPGTDLLARRRVGPGAGDDDESVANASIDWPVCPVAADLRTAACASWAAPGTSGKHSLACLGNRADTLQSLQSARTVFGGGILPPPDRATGCRYTPAVAVMNSLCRSAPPKQTFAVHGCGTVMCAICLPLRSNTLRPCWARCDSARSCHRPGTRGFAPRPQCAVDEPFEPARHCLA